MILSLQGCMAAGKTTAARYLAQHAPWLHVSYEDNGAVLAEVRRRGLDKTRYRDYIEIQRLWIQNEVRRWQAAQAFPCTVMDFGAEEILFYTLHYPRSIGQDWEVEGPLHRELDQLRRCLPDRILFLDASVPELRRRRDKDASRARGFFDHYISTLLPAKRVWFARLPNVDWLDTDRLSPAQTAAAALAWAERWGKPGTP